MPGDISKAMKMRRADVPDFLREQRENEQPCEYGHLSCSNWHGGACLDELLGLFPEFTDEP